MFPETASPSGISRALSLMGQTASACHRPPAHDGAFAAALPPLAIPVPHAPTPTVWGAILTTFDIVSFVTLLFFHLLSFVVGTVCLSFSCTPMAASGSCENFGHWFATASYLSFIFYKRNCHLFCRCLFFSMFSGNRLQLAAHFPVLVASLSLYFSGMFLGDFCASLVVSFCHYFLLFKFE